MKKVLLLFAVFTLTLASCGDDDLASAPAAASSTLVGDYVLTSLLADVPVYLDGVSTNASPQLMGTTFCFDNLDLNFLADGSFTAGFPELDLTINNLLSCTSSSVSGTYSLSATDVLSITLPVDGGTVTETKQVTITPTTLSFTLTASEVDTYFNPDPGTSLGAIGSLQVTYTRQ